MDERIHRVAAAANEWVYARRDAKTYIDGAPHIKHASLRQLYGTLLLEVFDAAVVHSPQPRILDLGAGEGSVTLSFLELGAEVVAVDISERQCENLRSRCERFHDRLEVRCEDIEETLKDKTQQFDIIAVNSFLHHIPDYLGMINDAVDLLKPYGQFFSFQDPLRYDSVGLPTRLFKNLAYTSWRLRRGDLIGGIRRRGSRACGDYLDIPIDNAEYHAIRNGVDQDAIQHLFESRDFDCRIITYFSTQSSLFQPIGTALGFKNLFGVIARAEANNC